MLSVLPLAREISDNDGGGSLQACQKINLVGVDLTFGCISDQDIISKLLANEIIIIKKICFSLGSGDIYACLHTH